MKFAQQPHTILLIRPVAFGFNSETMGSNTFQQSPEEKPDELREKALAEFDRMCDMLSSHEISIRVVSDTPSPIKPDAVFPNNWISFQPDGKIVLYPMQAENRRAERRADIIAQVGLEFQVREVIDLSDEENKGNFLEGTGSIVFDHVNRIAYACRSARTSESLFLQLCETLDFQPILFDAVDEQGAPIYHTNVMMSVGERFAVICLDAVPKDEDQEKILMAFARTEHRVIAISFAQMTSFAGNIIEVLNRHDEPFVLMSDTAFNTLLPGQVNAIAEFAEILPLQIPTIEKIGGGGVRCMVAGIHLPAAN